MLPFPIPDRMKHLKVDARGYAVPYGVTIDSDGTIHFAVNDEATRLRSITQELCSICGRPLFRGRWLVGGSLSAFHKHGAYIDPPMHNECSHYALQVCPYLAAPRYAGQVGLRKAQGRINTVLIDNTTIPGRPAGDIFVAVMATRVDIVNEQYHCKPRTPYSRVEFWRHGKQIPDAEGWAIVDFENGTHF